MWASASAHLRHLHRQSLPLAGSEIVVVVAVDVLYLGATRRSRSLTSTCEVVTTGPASKHCTSSRSACQHKRQSGSAQ
eukprot:6179903-Pleurochrysis_carterae.AAC.1